MTDLIKAYTKPGSNYPGYINASRDDNGEVVVTVRADPKVVKDSFFLCGFARDKGQPGRCTPGDDHCNNYCNMAPDKGPMQDHPKPTEQTICGDTATIRLTEAQWSEFKAGLAS